MRNVYYLCKSAALNRMSRRCTPDSVTGLNRRCDSGRLLIIDLKFNGSGIGDARIVETLNYKQTVQRVLPILCVCAVKLANMWLETSNEVYAVIFAKHRKQLKPHASFTDSEGDGYHWSSGKPEIMTEWGFENAETPLLKIVQTKQNKEQKDWDVEFFIYCA